MWGLTHIELANAQVGYSRLAMFETHRCAMLLTMRPVGAYPCSFSRTRSCTAAASGVIASAKSANS
jgi:hypothetical protein